MTADEFDKLCATIAGTADPAGDVQVAEAMETHRTSVRRWREGARSIPGPARVLARILADRAQAEADEEARQVRKTAKVRAA